MVAGECETMWSIWSIPFPPSFCPPQHVPDWSGLVQTKPWHTGVILGFDWPSSSMLWNYIISQQKKKVHTTKFNTNTTNHHHPPPHHQQTTIIKSSFASNQPPFPFTTPQTLLSHQVLTLYHPQPSLTGSKKATNSQLNNNRYPTPSSPSPPPLVIFQPNTTFPQHPHPSNPHRYHHLYQWRLYLNMHWSFHY